VEPVVLPNRVVLIVEDSEACAMTLEIALLAIPGVQVRVVATAELALEILAAAACEISALITDLHLPSMDGFGLIELIRADSRTNRLPIIVVSGDSNPKTPERTYHLGADIFFGKPFSPVRVREALKRLLDPSTKSQSAERSTAHEHRTAEARTGSRYGNVGCHCFRQR
jgi:DNA-binding response OmpR family regulator